MCRPLQPSVPDCGGRGPEGQYLCRISDAGPWRRGGHLQAPASESLQGENPPLTCLPLHCCQKVGKFVLPSVTIRPGDNDRQVASGKLVEHLGPVRHVGVEQKTVSRLHLVDLGAVAIVDLALQHVEVLNASVLENRKDVRAVGKCDEIWLEDDAAREDMTQQLVLMAGAGATPLGHNAPSRRDERGVALLLEQLEERGYGNTKRLGQRVQRGKRRRCRAGLDLGQHANRYPSAPRQLADSEVRVVTQGFDAPTD